MRKLRLIHLVPILILGASIGLMVMSKNKVGTLFLLIGLFTGLAVIGAREQETINKLIKRKK